MKNKAKFFFKKYNNVIKPIFFILFFALAILPLCFTRDFCLEMACNEMTEPRKHSKNDYETSLIKMKYEGDSVDFDCYSSIFDNYVYDFTIDRDAIVTDSNIDLYPSDDNISNILGPYSVSLISQFLYTEVEYKQNEHIHVLRHGRYGTYLPISYATNGANSFLYVSDIIANSWIEQIGKEKLQISIYDNLTEQFSKLINYFDKNKCLFKYNNISFRVSNVYYSNFGYSERTKIIHGEFALSHILGVKNLCNNFSFHYEIETHLDTYGNKKILQLFYKLYGPNVSVFIYSPTYDGSKKVVFNQELTDKINYILKQRANDWLCSISVFIILSHFLVQMLLIRANADTMFSFALIMSFIFLYGIVATYLYFYSRFGLVLVIMLVSYLILRFRIVKKQIGKVFYFIEERNDNKGEKDITFTEITI